MFGACSPSHLPSLPIDSYTLPCLQEHEKRAWSVHISPANPNMFVSASDDGKGECCIPTCSLIPGFAACPASPPPHTLHYTVKVWTRNVPKSVATLESGPGLCTSRFHPTRESMVAYSGAGKWMNMLSALLPLPQMIDPPPPSPLSPQMLLSM